MQRSPRPQVVVEADGGSRGNPGVAGYGALVRDATGRVVRELAAPLGRASNNVAEYTGLIEGLRAARDLADGVDVEARMDSKLVVEQMSGRWKIKHADMARLAAQAREIVDDIEHAGGRVRFTWVPRAKNAAADALSNAGMDGKTIDRTHGGSPDEQTAGIDQSADAVGQQAVDPAEALAPASEPLPRRAPEPDLGMGTRIVLVRHGVTDFTSSGRLDGRGGSDPDLNAEGLRQARAAAAGVAALLARAPSDGGRAQGKAGVRVVTSSLARAQQTGRVVASALGVRAEQDDDWDELAFGEWDGARVTDLARSHGGDLSRIRHDEAFAPPGGESSRELSARVSGALERALAVGGTVVVATHRAPIGHVLATALAIPTPQVWRLAIDPASLTSIRWWGDGECVIDVVNDTSHLR